MEAQVSNAIFAIGQKMDDAQINNFNSAIAAVSTYMQDNCEAHNCLNTTDLDPSQRNAATGRAGASCVAAYKPVQGSDCSNVVWDPQNPRLCRGADAFGTTYEGVCSADGQCYHSGVGFAGTIEAYQKLKVRCRPGVSVQRIRSITVCRHRTCSCSTPPSTTSKRLTTCTAQTPWWRTPRAPWCTSASCRNCTCWAARLRRKQTSGRLPTGPLGGCKTVWAGSKNLKRPRAR